MAVTVQIKPALTAVSRAAAASDARAGIPILTCLRISATGGEMRVSGTNIDMWIDTSLSCEGDLPPTCVGGAKLLAALKACGAACVRLELRPSGLMVSCDGGRALLPTLPADEFPVGREPESPTVIRVAGAELARAIAMVEPSVSVETARLYLNGAWLHSRPRLGLWLAASDGHRLDRVSVAAVVNGRMPPDGCILPRPLLRALAGMAGEGEVTLHVDAGMAHARAESVTVASRLIAGPFPDIDRIMPPAERPIASFHAAEMMAAVGRVAWASDAQVALIGLRFARPESGLLWAWNGSAEAEVACAVTEEVEIGFNARYLASLLSRLKDSEVELHLRKVGDIAFARFVAADSDGEHLIGSVRIEPYREISDG